MGDIVELAKAVVDGLRAMKKELDGIEGILNHGVFRGGDLRGNGAVTHGMASPSAAPKAKKKGKRKYTKRADYWANPVKKHKK